MNDNLPTQLNLNSPKVIETIKKTVAAGVDDIELAMFLELCKSSGLNPFKREAWCIKAGGRAQIMVGFNGYLKIANSHQQFDGMEIELKHDEKGALVAAICKVHRKDRKYPSTGIAIMSEYKKGTPIWSQMPSVMLSKVAKCIAIREAFPLETAGTYAEEEMPPEFSASKITASVAVADDIPPPSEKRMFHYMINAETVGEERLPAALQILKKAGAQTLNEFGLFGSMRRIPKFDAYEIKDDEEAYAQEASA